MENKGIINCPNCNKRIFADIDKCPYCKYKLNKPSHKFDKEIYDFLFNTYSQNKNKAETIKLGMNKFNMDIKKTKEIVDYISEEIYYDRLIKSKSVPTEELPTNGLDYSNLNQKNKLIRNLIMATFYWIIAFIFIANFGIENIASILIIIIGTIALIYAINKPLSIPPPPHTFTFSFPQYFLHCFMPKVFSIILIILIAFPIVKNHIANPVGMLIFFIIISSYILFIIILVELISLVPQSFTVDYGCIQYQHSNIYSYPSKDMISRYASYTYYDIYSIKKVTETFNKIIIYGYIEKHRSEHSPSGVQLSSSQRFSCLKVPKSFKNNKNLIKALKIYAEQTNKKQKI